MLPHDNNPLPPRTDKRPKRYARHLGEERKLKNRAKRPHTSFFRMVPRVGRFWAGRRGSGGVEFCSVFVRIRFGKTPNRTIEKPAEPNFLPNRTAKKNAEPNRRRTEQKGLKKPPNRTEPKVRSTSSGGYLKGPVLEAGPRKRPPRNQKLAKKRQF